MSKALEAVLANLSPRQQASLMQVAHQISAEARAKFGVDVPLDDVAGLMQVREAVFYGSGALDEIDLSNAMHNLQKSSATVREEVARQQERDNANSAEIERLRQQGAAVEEGETEITADMLQGLNPQLRMAMARKHGVGDSGVVNVKPGRPERQIDPDAKALEPAQTEKEAQARINEARRSAAK